MTPGGNVAVKLGQFWPAAAGMAGFLTLSAQNNNLFDPLDRYLTDQLSGVRYLSLRALGQLKPLLTRVITSDHFRDTFAGTAEVQQDIARQAQAHVDALVRAQVPTVTFPSFNNPQELTAWRRDLQAAQDQGLLDPTTIARIDAHFRAEDDRLTAALAGLPGEAAMPAPSPDLLGGATEALGGLALAGAGIAATQALLKVLTQATTATTEAIRGQHTDRLRCVETTGSILRRALTGVALPIGLGAFALGSSQGREIIDKAIGVAWDGVFNVDIIPKPANPDTALAAARTLFAEKAVLGATAHLMAVTAEANSNVKHMGLGYVAAFLSDLAGFQRLANMTMGEAEQAAVGIPMRRKVNRDYRPNLPMIQDLEMTYAKKEITPEQLAESLAEYGLSDFWVKVFKSHLYLDPRLTEIVRIGQFFNPLLVEETRAPPPIVKAWTDARPWLLESIGVTREEWDANWFYYYRVSKGGYEPSDVRVVVETANRAVVRREQTLMLDAVTRLFRDGFIGRDQLVELTEEAWGVRAGPGGDHTFRGNPVLARVRATEVRTLYEELSDKQEIALRALSRGLVSEAEVAEDLLALGMPQSRVEAAIVREKMGLIPRTRLAVAAVQEFQAVQGDGEADGG